MLIFLILLKDNHLYSSSEAGMSGQPHTVTDRWIVSQSERERESGGGGGGRNQYCVLHFSRQSDPVGGGVLRL